MEQTARLADIVARLSHVAPAEISPGFSVKSLVAGSIDIHLLESALREHLKIVPPPLHGLKTYEQLEATVLGTSRNLSPASPTIGEPGAADGLSPSSPGRQVASRPRPPLTCGVDVEHVSKLPIAADYWAHEFYINTFTPAEIAYCARQTAPRPHFAARWCAKEALKKCDHTFLAEHMTDVQITHDELGAPVIESVRTQQILPFAVSLTHSNDIAAAIVSAARIAGNRAARSTWRRGAQSWRSPRFGRIGLFNRDRSSVSSRATKPDRFWNCSLAHLRLVKDHRGSGSSVQSDAPIVEKLMTNRASVLRAVGAVRVPLIAPAIGIVALVVGAFVVQQAVLFSESQATGIVRQTYAAPFYGYMKSPAGLPRQAGDKFGADYMSLYFTAENYLQTGAMYDNNSDPWLRSAVTFPPHLIYLVAHSIQRLSFPASVLLNGFLQISLFLVAAFLFDRHLPSVARFAGLLFAGLMLFCTPIGTTWFERSQTDLYVGISFVFFLKAIRDNRPLDFVLAGVFGSLKWSSLPFLASSILVYLWFSTKPMWHKMKWAGTSMAIAVLPALIMGRHSIDYLRLVAESEINDTPVGLSLAHYLPLFLAKTAVFILPALLIVLHRFWKKTSWEVQSYIEAIFWSANAFICVGYGTVAYEYRLVAMLFLVPLIISGRSILVPDARARLSSFSRVCGIVIVLVAFRTQTHVDVVDSLLRHGRAVIPLMGSTFVLMAVSLWAALRTAPGAEGLPATVFDGS